MEDYSSIVNPHVKRVIQSFQNAAVRSLSGPNGLPLRTGGVLSHIPKMSAVEVEEYHKALAATKKISEEKNVEYDNPFLARPPFPIQQMPVFTRVDTTKSERSDTILEGETIACFTVGGEKRLCLPQILNTVLRDFSLPQINSVCDELHIFCARCNQIQLETLKVLNILPSSAPSCGLITKTDAERLCNALLHGNPERSLEPPSRNSFKVYHECFGKCKGMFNTENYTSPDSKCIRCVDCYGMFSPPKFVCHSHKSLENRTCHWGFDSANWRSYLLLAKDQNMSDSCKLQEAIEEVKSRFDPSHKHKRRQSPERSVRIESSNSKRVKTESGSDTSSDVLSPSPTQQTGWEAMGMRQLTSDFHPWSQSLLSAIKEGKLMPPPAIMRDGLAGILPSYLHTGPPVLLNPERVVPYSESERYERHFTPNVSLAPSLGQKGTPEDEDDEISEKPSSSQTNISGCLTSESLLRKALPSGFKIDADNRDTMEYDIATDTDDSSMASPTDSCKDLSDLPVYESTLEHEMDMIRSVLEGKVDAEARSHFFQDISKMRTKTEETVQWLLRKIDILKRELETLRRHNQELGELVSKTEIEKRNLALEKVYAMKEARSQKQQSQIQNKIDLELETRLRNMETLYQEAYNENLALRHELAAMSEKFSSVKYPNGIDKSLKSSCLRMALDSTASQEASSANKKQPLDLEVKKERDITVD